MANHSLALLSILDAGGEMNETKNWTMFPTNESLEGDLNSGDIDHMIFLIFLSIVVVFGLVGNGVVIWSLGCHLKRNSFTIFILNLSVADSGLLLSLIFAFLGRIFHFHLSVVILFSFLSMYITGQMLLTAISIDRCLSVLFPIWHRCRRPPCLSTIMCTIIWVISFLIFAIPNTVFLIFSDIYAPILIAPFMVSTFLCLPFMVISGLILFIKVCPKLQRHKRKRLLLTVLLTLFFFLIFGFPLNALLLLDVLLDLKTRTIFFQYSALCSALNSSVNPLIYFLAGRWKGSQTRESIKVILLRVFKDTEDSGR